MVLRSLQKLNAPYNVHFGTEKGLLRDENAINSTG
jgi:hypothetical protein